MKIHAILTNALFVVT